MKLEEAQEEIDDVEGKDVQKLELGDSLISLTLEAVEVEDTMNERRSDEASEASRGSASTQNVNRRWNLKKRGC